MASIGASEFFKRLKDVVVTSPSNGDVATYVAADGKWENLPNSGGGIATVSSANADIAVNSTDPANPVLTANSGLTSGKLVKVVSGSPSSSKYLNGAGVWTVTPVVQAVHTDVFTFDWTNLSTTRLDPSLSDPMRRMRQTGSASTTTVRGRVLVSGNGAIVLHTDNADTANAITSDVTVVVTYLGADGNTFTETASYSVSNSVPANTALQLAFAQWGGGTHMGLDGSLNINLISTGVYDISVTESLS